MCVPKDVICVVILIFHLIIGLWPLSLLYFFIIIEIHKIVIPLGIVRVNSHCRLNFNGHPRELSISVINWVAKIPIFASAVRSCDGMESFHVPSLWRLTVHKLVPTVPIGSWTKQLPSVFGQWSIELAETGRNGSEVVLPDLEWSNDAVHTWPNKRAPIIISLPSKCVLYAWQTLWPVLVILYSTTVPTNFIKLYSERKRVLIHIW